MGFQIARRTNFVSLPFLFCMVVGWRLKNLDGSSPILGVVKKHISVAARLSRTFIHSTDTDGTLLHTSSSPLLLTYDCWSISLLK